MIETADGKDNLLVKYLFHELSELKVEELEDEMLRDDELFERMQVVEMKLIDSYVRREMTEEERSRFQRRFLASPSNQSKVEEARAFHRGLRALREKQPVASAVAHTLPPRRWFTMSLGSPAWAAVLIVVGLCLVAGLVTLLWRPRPNVTTTVVQERKENTHPVNANSGEPSINVNRSPAEIVSSNENATVLGKVGQQKDKVALPPPGPELARVERPMEVFIDENNSGFDPRGAGGLQRITIPGVRRFVRLTLRLRDYEGGADKFKVYITDKTGRQVFPLGEAGEVKVRMSGKSEPNYFLSIQVPTEYLKADESYIFNVYGKTYTPFQVTKK
jgi:hypothetical protein